MLDVNMGVPLTDEADLLARAITMIQQLTDKPICIDSSVVDALEAGLSVYQGRALVNLITAEDERMAQILLLVKKYDAAVIALPNDEDEIPMEVEKRVDLTRKIVEVATTEYGIAAADIVIDPLAMPIGADQTVVVTVLETMRRIRDEFGVNMTCGASNVSFGMPSRHALGATFLPMAMQAGLTSAIPGYRTPQIVEAVKAADLLLGHDDGAAPGSRPPREAGIGVSIPWSSDPGDPRARSSRSTTSARGTAASTGIRTAAHDGGGRVELAFTVEDAAGAPTTQHGAGAAGVTVFDSASWNGIAIDSTCGGHGTCHKCKVRVEGPTPITRHDVHVQPRAARRRLAAGLPGPGHPQPGRRRAAADHAAKAATVGVGRQVILRPAVQKRYVELDEPTLADQHPDLDRLLAAIDDLEPTADLHVLRRCPPCCVRPTSR